jgi:hypothetical protein
MGERRRRLRIPRVPFSVQLDGEKGDVEEIYVSSGKWIFQREELCIQRRRKPGTGNPDKRGGRMDGRAIGGCSPCPTGVLSNILKKRLSSAFKEMRGFLFSWKSPVFRLEPGMPVNGERNSGKRNNWS